MSWNDSTRRARLPADWPRRRAVVLRRCGGRCEHVEPGLGRCHGKATDVDHVVPGDDHSYGNLRGLCAYHHGIKSSAEGADARRRKAGSAKRPTEKHPGER